MKWLKLDCNFPDDPKIKALAREWGGETAAAFWTLLLAFVGANGGHECRVRIDENGQHSAHYVASRLSSKPKVTLSRLERAAQLGLIDREAWEQHREIYIPNMLKRLDDYTRKVRTKSGEYPESVQKTTHADKDIRYRDTDIREKTYSRPTADFEGIWERYPNKDSRKESERHFNGSVKTDEDVSDIQKALTNYLQHLKVNTWKRPKSGKTWFNNWRDWINWIEPEGNGNGTHRQNGPENRPRSGDGAAIGNLPSKPYVPRQ